MFVPGVPRELDPPLGKIDEEYRLQMHVNVKTCLFSTIFVVIKIDKMVNVQLKHETSVSEVELNLPCAQYSRGRGGRVNIGSK